jgi:hypothetical protein
MKDKRSNRQRTIDKIDIAIRFVEGGMFENASRIFGSSCVYCRDYLNEYAAGFQVHIESGAPIPDDFIACHSCPVYKYYQKVCTNTKAYKDVKRSLEAADKPTALEALRIIRDDVERMTD